MDPPIGHGFREKQRTQLLQRSKVSMKTTIEPLKKMCEARQVFHFTNRDSKNYVKSNSKLSSTSLNKSGNKNFSNATGIATGITNNTTATTTSNTNTNTDINSATINAITTGNSNYTTIQNLDLSSCCKYIQPLYYISNMKSLIISLITVLILNNFGCFVSTNPSVAAYTQRENTRILPLQAGGQTDGSRITFGESTDAISSIASPNVPCPPGMFRCNDGKCITSLWVCNYQKDCDGGEDEQQSCPPPECEGGQISCSQYIFNKTYCLPPHFRCDMTDDCEDKSDEAQCTYRKCQTTDVFCNAPGGLLPSDGSRLSGPCVPNAYNDLQINVEHNYKV